MTRSTSRSRSRRAPNHEERDNAMATFLNGMDARALLYMFSQINDRPLDSLKGKSVDFNYRKNIHWAHAAFFKPIGITARSSVPDQI